MLGALLARATLSLADGVSSGDAGSISTNGGRTSQHQASLDPSVKVLVDRVQAFYEKTSDFKASFKQVYTYTSARRTQVSTGKVTFLKPAMMRWDYQAP